MKHVLVMAALLALAAAGAGCSRYEVTLTNGNVMTAKSKPKLDPATDHYRFKDATGKEVWVPSMRIRSIEAK
ncbi:MAG: YgdI/YgdR family lipoprotein [Verrucomicrobiae bacterium]|nr:YgdI/YgdR family lipoprotein [Verrucomicrobiae bacterium]